MGPSAVWPLPSCQPYEAASPRASNVTVSGAAPAVALAKIVTLGGSAFAGATQASITRTTTLATRSTQRPYTLIWSATTQLRQAGLWVTQATALTRNEGQPPPNFVPLRSARARTAVRVCHSAVPLLGLGVALLTAGAEQLSCVVCGGFARLLALARDRETRALTPQERTLYLAGT